MAWHGRGLQTAGTPDSRRIVASAPGSGNDQTTDRRLTHTPTWSISYKRISGPPLLGMGAALDNGRHQQGHGRARESQEVATGKTA